MQRCLGRYSLCAPISLSFSLSPPLFSSPLSHILLISLKKHPHRLAAMGWLTGLFNVCCAWAFPTPTNNPSQTNKLSPQSQSLPASTLNPTAPHSVQQQQGQQQQYQQHQQQQQNTCHSAPLSSWESNGDFMTRPIFPLSITEISSGSHNSTSNSSSHSLNHTDSVTLNTADLSAHSSSLSGVDLSSITPKTGQAVFGGVAELVGGLLCAYAGEGRGPDPHGRRGSGAIPGECFGCTVICVCVYVQDTCQLSYVHF